MKKNRKNKKVYERKDLYLVMLGQVTKVDMLDEGKYDVGGKRNSTEIYFAIKVGDEYDFKYQLVTKGVKAFASFNDAEHIGDLYVFDVKPVAMISDKKTYTYKELEELETVLNGELARRNCQNEGYESCQNEKG